MHGIIPYMFDRWVDSGVHLLLLKAHSDWTQRSAFDVIDFIDEDT